MNIVTFKWEANIDTPFPSRNPKKFNDIEYDGNYVNNHFNNIGKVLKGNFKYTCVTDNSKGISKEIQVIPIWDYLSELGGCIRRLFIYSEEAKSILGDKFFTADLDTVFIKDFSDLYDTECDLAVYRTKNPEKIKSGHEYRMHPGISIVKPGVYSAIWDDLQENPKDKIALSRTKFTGTDQSWFNYHFHDTKPNLNLKYFDTSNGFYEASYFLYNHIYELPKDATLISFAGPRDPYQEQMLDRFKWLKDYI